MTHATTHYPARQAAAGRGTGLLLIILGAWGAIVPFIGPYFGYAYTPDTAWTYTTGRLVLSILPGAAAVAGGLLVLAAGSGPASAAGALLAACGGAWLVVGVPVVTMAVRASTVTPGAPVAGPGSSSISPAILRLLEGLGFYYGLGVLMVFLAARALGAARRGLAAGYPAAPAEQEYAFPEQVYPGY